MDVWKIGVAISMTNGVSAVLAVIAADVLGLKGKVSDVEKGFKSWQPAIAGAMAILAGGAMIGAVAKMAEYGGQVNHQLELMKLAGMQNIEIQQSIAQAMKTSADVQTTTYAGNLEHIRELRYAFGQTGTANQNLTDVSRSNAILNAVKGGGTDQVWELVKSLEQKGITTDPQTFMSYVNEMTKVTEATGGRVTPASFMSAIKYGRTAALGWDEDFITGALPRLIQSMSSTTGTGSGSGGPGNALMSAFAKVVQGQMTLKAADEFDRLGLMINFSNINGSGQALGDVAQSSKFAANPYDWVQTVLMPALKAHDITSQTDVIQEISKLFPVRTASQVITEMGLQGSFTMGANSPFEKDMRLQGGAMGLDPAYKELSSNDYQTNMAQLSAQMQTFLQVVGGPAAQAAIPVLRNMTDAMTAMSKFAQDNQGTIKIVTEAMLAVGAALVVLGSAAVAVAAARVLGPVALAVAGIGTILVVMGVLNWDSLNKFMTGYTAAFMSLANLPWNIATAGLSSLSTAIQNFIKAIGSFSLPGAAGAVGNFLNSGGPPPGNHLKPSSFVPPPSGSSPMAVHTALYMDGRKIGQGVSKAMAKSSYWSNNSSTFDASSMAPVTDQTFA